MPAKRLKVFQTRIGFFDAVVAAPSQKAALQAWGSRLNLFGQGLASIASDPQAVRAATAKPGVVLRRAAGSKDEYSEEPSLPEVGKRRPTRLKKPAVTMLQKPPKPRPAPPDRSKLEAAGRALHDLGEEKAKARAEFAKRRRALEADERQSLESFGNRQRQLARVLAREKQAYKEAQRKSRG